MQVNTSSIQGASLHNSPPALFISLITLFRHPLIDYRLWRHSVRLFTRSSSWPCIQWDTTTDDSS